MSQTQTKAPNQAEMINGVNVTQTREILQALQRQPELGKFRFRARNRWLGGTLNRTTIGSFYGVGKEDENRTQPHVLDCDEPPVLMGQDRGANPVEHLLNALAGCVTTTMVAHSAARGVELESVESKLEGDIDVRGFLGIAPDVEKGYKSIRVTFRVKSDAPAEKLLELAKMSPVYNTLTKPTPVEIRIEKV